jgi:hypothetical protein
LAYTAIRKMEQTLTKKPNMFGGGAKPGLLSGKMDRPRPVQTPADVRSSLNEGESSFRPDSKLGEGRNRPFGKLNAASRVSRPESSSKNEREEPTVPILETVSKPKVNFTGEIKVKPKKKDDSFFDDPVVDSRAQKHAKPDLMKSRPAGTHFTEEPKLKEKNFFDEDFDDVPVAAQDLRPNLGKPRLGASTNFVQNNLRTSVAAHEPQHKEPIGEFEVYSHEQGRL